ARPWCAPSAFRSSAVWVAGRGSMDECAWRMPPSVTECSGSTPIPKPMLMSRPSPWPRSLPMRKTCAPADSSRGNVAEAVLGGIRTHYDIVGDGPPLLMYAPGGFDAAIDKWRTQGVYARVKLLDHLPSRY